jgi:hypothetical protein
MERFLTRRKQEVAMKKTFILLLVTVGLAGCETYHTGPYSKMGAYGFTYDLDSSPSPFVDTRYRPLTPYDLAAPIIVVVTNQPPPKFVYQQMPPIGETHYAGESPTPAAAGTVVASPPIIESAGAQPGQSAAGSATAGAAAPGAAVARPGFYGTGGDTVILPQTIVGQTNTNVAVTNITTNAFGLVTNTNGFGMVTNTNALAGGTNRAINEPAGTQLQTNRDIGEPPGTQLRTNRGIGEPPVPPQPPQSGNGRVLLTPQPTTQPQIHTPSQPQAPAIFPTTPAPGFRQPPPQRPTAQPQVPPASAPQNPPSPQNAPAPQSAPAPSAPAPTPSTP